MAKKSKKSKGPKFSADMFQPTRFHTAEEKAKFANQFVKLVTGGFQAADYPKWFYRELTNTRGHIAHCDQGGFWHTWFSTAAQQRKFLDHWREQPVYGDPQFTYSDVERKLQQWIIDCWDELLAIVAANEQVEQAAALAEVERRQALAEQTHQDFIIAAKSQNTGDFGHYGYILVAEDGSAWEVSRTLHSPWTAGQQVRCRLDARREPIFMGCECPRRLANVPAETATELWVNARKKSEVAGGADPVAT